jgi:hypothetical protein
VSTDLVIAASVGLFSASRQAANTPKYGQGWGAYGERFASTAADGFSDIMIGGAIRLHGCSRIHATSIREQARPVPESAKRCSVRSSRKEDNGKWQPTYSSLGRDLASSALAKPLLSPNRGAELVFGNFAIGTAKRIGASVAQEFLFSKFTRRGGHLK